MHTASPTAAIHVDHLLGKRPVLLQIKLKSQEEGRRLAIADSRGGGLTRLGFEHCT